MEQEFEMTQEEMDHILEINKRGNNPVMMIGTVSLGNEVREGINDYWVTLGNKYGFKWDTVEGSSKGKLFFLAEPKPKEKDYSRRSRLDLCTPAELAIYNAMVELEKTGADVRLTEAGLLLQQAKNLVADFVDDF